MKAKYILIFITIPLLIAVVLFFLWSKQTLISLFLIFIIDLLLTRKTATFFKNNSSKNVYNIVKYIGYILLPILFAIFIRTFFIDVYFVPSSSMERTLFPNDYVVVNKFTYGTKTPKRVQDIPVIGSLFKTNKISHEYNLYSSLRAFKSFQREDIVVFKSVEENDKFLIKRIIGLPGDALQIKSTQLFINDTLLLENENYCYTYIDNSKKDMSLIQTYSNIEFEKLGGEQQQFIKKNIQLKPRKQSFLFPYPFAKEHKWTRDNYGELIIPKKGMKMLLTKDNFEIYKYIIKNYELTELKIKGNKSISYIFKNNYYFMMGDNRHASKDSRYFGFVPESYIQGKMIGVFSKERLFQSQGR